MRILESILSAWNKSNQGKKQLTVKIFDVYNLKEGLRNKPFQAPLWEPSEEEHW